jgi:RNA polymerase sigma-70 factor, ECF subfamily
MEENAAHPRLNTQLGLMREHVIEDRTIEACQSGDADAFRVLFENYKDRVYSIALGYFNGDESSARDITQTVFLKLMTHISTFHNRSEFSTWLYRMVANACLDQKRSLRRLLFLGDTTDAALPDRRKTAEERYIARELEAEVREAIAGLRPRLRIAILLKYFEDLSYAEMAAALGCSSGTIASRLNRGHRILARKLAHLQSAGVTGKLGR